MRDFQLVDFTFNLGTGRLQTSTLRRRVNQRDWEAVATELRRWVYGGGKVLPGLRDAPRSRNRAIGRPIDDQRIGMNRPEPDRTAFTRPKSCDNMCPKVHAMESAMADRWLSVEEIAVASRTIVSISDVFRYSSPAMFCKHWSLS